MRPDAIRVVKNSGQIEEFDEAKVRNALIRAGANQAVSDEVTKEVSSKARDGMRTSEIFGMAFSLLEARDTTVAARFNIKNALIRFGPTGFPFEKYVARLLQARGFKTVVGQTYPGHCVSQEVDITAEDSAGRYMVECKFHNQLGIYTGLKEAMYTYARFQDIIEGGGSFTRPWMVTNTKITDEAIKYSLCRGMRMTAWGYPPGDSLQDMIDCECLYPVTVLSELDDPSLKGIIEAGAMTVKDLNLLDEKTLGKLTSKDGTDLAKLSSIVRDLAKSASEP
jgi:hypothetical protein